ncbi:MAG: hypothetical protein U0798_18300 [Gemmataceae bacterium]
MPRVVHFEIHADEPTRAVAFYTDLFGWKTTKWGGPMEYYLCDTGEGLGINGGIVRRMGAKPADGQPVNSYVCTVDVPNVDQYFAKALALGARLFFLQNARSGHRLAGIHQGFGRQHSRTYAERPDGQVNTTPAGSTHFAGPGCGKSRKV